MKKSFVYLFAGILHLIPAIALAHGGHADGADRRGIVSHILAHPWALSAGILFSLLLVAIYISRRDASDDISD